MKKLLLAFILFTTSLLYFGCDMEDEPRPRPEPKKLENLVLPLQMSKFFLPTGIWGDGDGPLACLPSFSTDTTWGNATANFEYTVGNSKWGGCSFLHDDSWDDTLRISEGITKVSFSIKADPGVKFTVNVFPDKNMGKHVAISDGNWHFVEIKLDTAGNKQHPTLIKGGNIMNAVWEPTSPWTTSVGTKYNFGIKNIILE